MKAGPKRAVTADPLDLSGLPERGPERVRAFVETFCRVPKGVGALEPFVLRPWQLDVIDGLFGDPRPRQALLSLPRGNGKSTKAAALALYGLFGDRVEGAQVLVVASDERQARIVFGIARRMVELSPELAERTQVFQDRLYVPQTDSEMRPLPAVVSSLHGWDPSLLIVDELHAVTPEVWEACTSAAGKRPESLTLAISTPADSRDSVMWDLVEHGRAGTDLSFYFREWGAPPGCAIDDEAAWADANPSLHDFLAVDALRATMHTMREASFRRLRLGQWVENDSSWLPFGSWEALGDTGREVAGPVVLAFDGSASGDSTALVGCTVEPDPHLFVVGVWENPGDDRWRVPRSEVDAAVAEAMERLDVVELACDPWGWRSEIEQWAARWPGRVVEFATNVVGRMAPATDRVYQLVAEGRLSHDGHETLARHVRNCVARSTAHGDLVHKDRKSSPRKIDAAVAAIVAVDRAAWHQQNARPRRRLLVVK